MSSKRRKSAELSRKNEQNKNKATDKKLTVGYFALTLLVHLGLYGLNVAREPT